MKTVFETLYDAHIKDEPFSANIADKEFFDEECLIYEELYESLSKPLLTKFRRYCELQEIRNNKESQVAYEQGFKTAIQLIVDSLNQR